MIDVAFYYIFYCSAVLFYGIGMNREAIFSASLDKNLCNLIIKCCISTVCSVTLTWIVIMNVLIPMHLVELFPLVALLVFIIITVFVEMITHITTSSKTAEFAVSYLIALLALNEAAGIVEAMVIAASCMISFVIILPILYALRKRIDIARPRNDRINRKTLIMLAMAMLILCFSVWNVSWLSEVRR
ncbi:MAG: hypothetical protein IJR50_01300 [Treponema sp.]|nr:hypothetical protein [Treponema sp.]